MKTFFSLIDVISALRESGLAAGVREEGEVDAFTSWEGDAGVCGVCACVGGEGRRVGQGRESHLNELPPFLFWK